MPTPEEQIEQLKHNARMKEVTEEYNARRSNRIFIGEGDTPAEAEAKVQQQLHDLEARHADVTAEMRKIADGTAIEAEMKRMEAEVEQNYDAALKSTDPESLVGQVVRAFPPMTGDQLMSRLSKRANRYEPAPEWPFGNIGDEKKEPYKMNATNDPRDPKLQFFAFAHLREDLQEIVVEFAALAKHLVATLPANAERTIALNLLIQAKDAAVRAKVYRAPEE